MSRSYQWCVCVTARRQSNVDLCTNETLLAILNLCNNETLLSILNFCKNESLRSSRRATIPDTLCQKRLPRPTSPWDSLPQRRPRARIPISKTLTVNAPRGLRSLKLFAKTTPDLRLTTAQARAGQPYACPAFAQALFVLAILSAKSSSNSCAICSGGPDSMMLRSGKPWLKSWPKLL